MLLTLTDVTGTQIRKSIQGEKKPSCKTIRKWSIKLHQLALLLINHTIFSESRRQCHVQYSPQFMNQTLCLPPLYMGMCMRVLVRV